ncbi:hypothetical protein ACPCSD_14590 [Streptomyces griseoincarnatus]|uniref:hypothetical protein n=1 Tax=Streptomyces sp. TRM75561 TaxID=2975269 RepID=UPI00244904AE|nr:hypothetical protein [Streptomyces sp. TRM75561]MDH3037911.1 hypothetical protein [Streptomyces sp. TRM75561]
MATYTVRYLIGDEESFSADGVEYDSVAEDYTFTGANGQGAIALVPANNVLSIRRGVDDE